MVADWHAGRVYGGDQSYLILRHFDVFKDACAAVVRFRPIEDSASIGGAVRLRVALVGRTIVSAVHLCRELLGLRGSHRISRHRAVGAGLEVVGAESSGKKESRQGS